MLKKLNKKGFTLAELLVVVAIIAILVAVSIPIFSSKLEASRESTDIANMRAAKAAATVEYLDTGLAVDKFYDADAGKLVAEEPDAYGKGTSTDGKSSYKGYVNTTDYTNAYIKVKVDEETGEVDLSWVGATAKN